jgi:hypothetical protein
MKSVRKYLHVFAETFQDTAVIYEMKRDNISPRLDQIPTLNVETSTLLINSMKDLTLSRQIVYLSL